MLTTFLLLLNIGLLSTIKRGALPGNRTVLFTHREHVDIASSVIALTLKVLQLD